ncbi:hypothetical protein AAMO2058_001198200 [Amorphochlora amoebiformis]
MIPNTEVWISYSVHLAANLSFLLVVGLQLRNPDATNRAKRSILWNTGCEYLCMSVMYMLLMGELLSWHLRFLFGEAQINIKFWTIVRIWHFTQVASVTISRRPARSMFQNVGKTLLVQWITSVCVVGIGLATNNIAVRGVGKLIVCILVVIALRGVITMLLQTERKLENIHTKIFTQKGTHIGTHIDTHLASSHMGPNFISSQTGTHHAPNNCSSTVWNVTSQGGHRMGSGSGSGPSTTLSGHPPDLGSRATSKTPTSASASVTGCVAGSIYGSQREGSYTSPDGSVKSTVKSNHQNYLRKISEKCSHPLVPPGIPTRTKVSSSHKTNTKHIFAYPNLLFPTTILVNRGLSSSQVPARCLTSQAVRTSGTSRAISPLPSSHSPLPSPRSTYRPTTSLIVPQGPSTTIIPGSSLSVPITLSSSAARNPGFHSTAQSPTSRFNDELVSEIPPVRSEAIQILERSQLRIRLHLDQRQEGKGNEGSVGPGQQDQGQQDQGQQDQGQQDQGLQDQGLQDQGQQEMGQQDQGHSGQVQQGRDGRGLEGLQGHNSYKGQRLHDQGQGDEDSKFSNSAPLMPILLISPSDSTSACPSHPNLRISEVKHSQHAACGVDYVGGDAVSTMKDIEPISPCIGSLTPCNNSGPLSSFNNNEPYERKKVTWSVNYPIPDSNSKNQSERHGSNHDQHESSDDSKPTLTKPDHRTPTPALSAQSVPTESRSKSTSASVAGSVSRQPTELNQQRSQRSPTANRINVNSTNGTTQGALVAPHSQLSKQDIIGCAKGSGRVPTSMSSCSEGGRNSLETVTSPRRFNGGNMPQMAQVLGRFSTVQSKAIKWSRRMSAEEPDPRHGRSRNLGQVRRTSDSVRLGLGFRKRFRRCEDSRHNFADIMTTGGVVMTSGANCTSRTLRTHGTLSTNPSLDSPKIPRIAAVVTPTQTGAHGNIHNSQKKALSRSVVLPIHTQAHTRDENATTATATTTVAKPRIERKSSSSGIYNRLSMQRDSENDPPLLVSRKESLTFTSNGNDHRSSQKTKLRPRTRNTRASTADNFIKISFIPGLGLGIDRKHDTNDPLHHGSQPGHHANANASGNDDSGFEGFDSGVETNTSAESAAKRRKKYKSVFVPGNVDSTTPTAKIPSHVKSTAERSGERLRNRLWIIRWMTLTFGTLAVSLLAFSGFVDIYRFRTLSIKSFFDESDHVNLADELRKFFEFLFCVVLHLYGWTPIRRSRSQSKSRTNENNVPKAPSLNATLPSRSHHRAFHRPARKVSHVHDRERNHNASEEAKDD